MQAPLPPDESARLQALRDYNILDTPAEREFDDIAELGAQICDTPIALITLVDEDRQWFKSKVGVSQESTARDVAFCAHALLSPDILQVPDALAEARFADNPLVTGERGIRFYAGAPLITPEGHTLGTLCVIDRVPRRLTAKQAQALQVLSRHVMTQLQLRRLLREKVLTESDLRASLANQAKVEAALRRSEQEQRDLARRLEVEHARLVEAQALAKVGSWETDLSTMSVVWSEETHRIFQTDPRTFQPTHATFLDRTHPDDRAEVDRVFTNSLKEQTLHVLEHRVVIPHGGIKIVDERWRAFHDDAGRPVRVAGTCQDISERRQAEEAERINSRNYERRHAELVALTRNNFWDNGGELAALTQITESVSRALEVERVSIWRFTPDGSAIVCQDLFQASADRHSAGQELARASFPAYFNALAEHDVVAADDATHDRRTREFAKTYLEPAGIASMLDAPIKLGSILDGVLCVEQVGPARRWSHGEQSFAVSVGNLISLLLSQRALERSENRLRTIFESEPECVKIVSPAGLLLDINPVGLRMIEAGDRCDVLNRPVADFIHPADHAAYATLHERSIQGETGQMQLRVKGLKGTERWIETHAAPLREADGLIGSVLSVSRDITARKVTEEKMREQAALLDKAQDAIIVRDLNHRVLFWNKSAERLYGWKTDEALNQSVQTLLYRDLTMYDAAVQTTLAKGEWVGEIDQFTRDGKPLTIEGRWTLVRDDEGRPKSILAINTDISERKILEQQFLRAQRMESIGTLAGGIAHDLNNLLAPIVMGVDLLKRFGLNEQSLELVHNIERSAHRGSDLVKQVLSFARGVEGSRVTVFPMHIVREVEAIAQSTFPKNITFEADAPNNVWPITGDPTQLNQVLLNLCVNARDAMPDGGRLSVMVRNRTVTPADATLHPEVAPGRYVRIDVSDTGCGMSPQVIERIFEPFFTTKEMSKGTGLGLSTALGIIRSHGGFIHVKSAINDGCVFTLHLPASLETTPPDSTFNGAAETMPRGNGELVLVVDDEALIRDVTKQTLESFGYRVVTAEDGAHAMGVYALHRADIAVVLTDMMMPFMNGSALIAALIRLDPFIRIIAASGLNTHSDVMNAGVRHFLAKPYTANALLSALKTALEQPATQPSGGGLV